MNIILSLQNERNVQHRKVYFWSLYVNLYTFNSICAAHTRCKLWRYMTVSTNAFTHCIHIKTGMNYCKQEWKINACCRLMCQGCVMSLWHHSLGVARSSTTPFWIYIFRLSFWNIEQLHKMSPTEWMCFRCKKKKRIINQKIVIILNPGRTEQFMKLWWIIEWKQALIDWIITRAAESVLLSCNSGFGSSLSTTNIPSARYHIPHIGHQHILLWWANKTGHLSSVYLLCHHSDKTGIAVASSLVWKNKCGETQ